MIWKRVLQSCRVNLIKFHVNNQPSQHRHAYIVKNRVRFTRLLLYLFHELAIHFFHSSQRINSRANSSQRKCKASVKGSVNCSAKGFCKEYYGKEHRQPGIETHTLLPRFISLQSVINYSDQLP